MLNFNNFEYRKLVLPTDENEKKTLEATLNEKFINELKTSPECQEFFKNYSHASVEKFMQTYAKTKIEIIEAQERLLKEYEHDDNEEYLQNARVVLNWILQKKLFNLHLQWRAGAINIPEIKTSYDFLLWEENLEYCPFIPPITRIELDLMKTFLETNDFVTVSEEMDFIYVRFDDLLRKDEEDNYSNMPAWYETYDNMFGTGQLLQLPDVRTQKEKQYIKLVQETNRRENEKTKKNAPVSPSLGSIYDYINDIFEFTRKFEKDIYFKELFRLWYRLYYPEFNDSEYEPEDVEEAISVLENADRPVFISGNQIWHKAIVNAANQYITDRTLEVLDSVYEEYNTLSELGITKRFSPEEEKRAREVSLTDMYHEMILRGRELSGEPRNLDIH